ncbi:hypothetical protein BFW38_12735 [Terasakiispira papahanaumokuakeensis]|uniref:Protein SlyX homolog n=1 Tax=Terasakiispira papahanaumokuakeensis TaxID=197479 RepID=A0A1E2VB73_9GAMM|nr:SlyX family protein [Terasakiispira papahanaumokuakeensis]ODC04268.1 hypothetical protein BFW38_12735 [Terasakiispira papahanaumokuakeensis]
MDSSQKNLRLDERLDELESRQAFQDELLDRLNDEIIRQGQRLQTLQEGLQHLYQRFNEVRAPDDDRTPSLDDERPPHY